MGGSPFIISHHTSPCMINRFAVAPLSMMTRTLAEVAMGRQPPDYVITGARVLSTYSERMSEEREIWIKGGRIAAVKQAGSYPLLPGDHTIRYDALGGIIAPGLVDPQVNLSGSMMSACAYAEAALLNGTTTIVCDCESIASVCDGRGLKWFLMDARRAPLSVFVKVSGSIYACNGGDPKGDELALILEDWPEVVALGVKMELAGGELLGHTILAEALKGGRRVSGRIHDRDFVALNAAVGVTATYDAIDRDMAGDCLDAGQWLFLRGGSTGSPRNNFSQAVREITELRSSAKRICFCTDNRDAHDLFYFGLDWVVRQAVVAGVSSVTAWSMGSLHPATRYAMDGEIGGPGPSRRADLVLLNDDLEVQNTWYGGQLVVEDKQITAILDKVLSKRYHYPQVAYRTIILSRSLKLVPDLPPEPVTANIIGVVADSFVLEHRKITLGAARNWAELLDAHQLCFAVVARRSGGMSSAGHGLLQGFGSVKGAVASSAGHGAPSVIAVGSNPVDMKLALATVKEFDGGVCVVRDGQVLASVPLPVGGVLSDLRAPDVAQQIEVFKRAWTELGCTLPFASFSWLSDDAFPEIRLTDRGLILVPEMRIVPLFEPIAATTTL